MKLLKITIGVKVVLAIFIALLYFSFLTKIALKEDILNYYRMYSLSFIDLDNFNRLFNSIIDGQDRISAFRVNYLAHLLYASLSNFNYTFFIITNIMLLVLLYLFIIDKYLPYLSKYKYLLLFSMQNYIHFAYTWRQALALLLGILIFYNSRIRFQYVKLAIVSIFVHPIAFFFIALRFLLKTKILSKYVILNILLSFSVFWLFNSSSAIGSNVFDINIELQRTSLKWIAVLIFSLVPVFSCWKVYNLESKNIFVFIISFCLFTILFIYSDVFLSRILAAMIILIQFTHLFSSKKYLLYFVFGNISILFYFLLNVSDLWLFSMIN